MDRLTDKELLLAWANAADENAFRVLTARYGGFVYGAALRRVRESGLAQEITQDVFIVLGRRAGKLSSHVSFAGWLHRTTMLISLDRLRRKKRRETKLTEFEAMHADSPAHDPWKAAAPHLDEALDSLRNADRDLLMLHFAERFTFPEIAVRIGSTSDAVRMRTTRALQTLARILQRRGATMSVAALSAGLGGAFAQAAPLGLALGSAAVPGAAKVSVSTVVLHAFYTMKSLQYAAALLVLGFAGTAVFQQTQIARADERIADLKIAIGDRKEAVRINSETLAGGQAVDGLNLRELARAALDESMGGRWRVQRMLTSLGDNNLAGLLETMLGGALLPKARENLAMALLEEMARRSPELHLQGCLRVLKDASRAEFFRDVAERMKESASALALAKPEVARQWTRAHQDEWNEVFRRYAVWEDSSLEGRMAAGLLASDPRQAFALMEGMSAAAAAQAVEAAGKTLTAKQLRQVAEWAATRPDAKMRKEVLRTVGVATRYFVSKDKDWLQPVSELLRSTPISDSERGWLAARIGMEYGLSSEVEKSPLLQRAEWLQSFLPTAEANHAIGALAQMLEPPVALTYLKARLETQFDDNLIGGYIEEMELRDGVRFFRGSVPGGGLQGRTGFQLAVQVQDPDKRRKWLTLAWQDLFRHAPDEARALLAIPELNPGDRLALEKELAAKLEGKK